MPKRSNSTRRTGEVMNLTVEIHMSATSIVGSLPPCGGELERGANPGFGARGLPLSLTLPHKGGGNAIAYAGRGVR